MKFDRELLPGSKLLSLSTFSDMRGTFVKTFGASLFEANDTLFDMREEFYSLSKRNVIRGMHFQTPPHDHAKLVFCPVGAVLDVLVDLRRGPGFMRVASVVLNAREPAVLVIPRGVAHGFKALTDDSLMVYKTSSEHMPSHDAGIRWDSIDFDWQIESPPVVSARDDAHPSLSTFSSPF